MRFEWDEAKRLANIAKHGIDFLRAELVFDGRATIAKPSRHAGETRFITIARLDDKAVAVIWTPRGPDLIRIISARRARDAEEREHRQLCA